MNTSRASMLTAALILGCGPTQKEPVGNTGTRPQELDGGTASPPTFFITTMVHMEGGHLDDVDEVAFSQHLLQLRNGMDIAGEYAAKLTIESEQPFALAVAASGEPILTEAIERGHGVGTHCDIGYVNPPESVVEFARLLGENKALVDALVGPENNRGCSGAGSPQDWGTALIEAGFDYVDGIVGLHYLSMPLSERPDSTWTDEEIVNSGRFHDPAPHELEARTHPFMIANGRDFRPDADGALLVSGGGTWAIHKQADEGQCDPCIFDAADADAALENIAAALAVHDPDRIGKINFHIPVKLLGSANDGPMRRFYAGIERLVFSNQVAWATQGEVYDAFMDR